MRPFRPVISLEDARRTLEEHVRPITRTERVPLADAAGRVLAADVTSGVSVPPFARSAMDGFAVVAADTADATRDTPVRLRILERLYAGQVPSQTVVRGTCSEIATGAPLPPGAEAVVMVEDTRPGAEWVEVLACVTPGQNVGPAGADIAPGDTVGRQGEVITPSRAGALAAIGHADVEVFARPRVTVLSTGNEVVDPGMPLGPGQIHDVNRFTLSAVVAAHGCVPEPHRAARDTLDGLHAALDACSTADIIIFSGGSSVGTRDLIADVVASRGVMLFHGIAVRPGKPTAFALVEGVPFFGMPGNPTSCLSNAYVLLVPFLRATARLPPYVPRTLRVPLGRRIVSAAGRHQFYTVRLVGGVAMPAFKGSGDITSLSLADGYIQIPADEREVGEGTLVDVTLF